MLLNGIDLTPYLRVKKVSGRGLVNRQIGLLTLSGSDGAFYQRKRRPARELEIEADVFADEDLSLREKLDRLNGILNVDQPVPIIFPDEPHVTYYGIPASSDGNDEVYFLFKGKLLIVCPDPNKYGVSQSRTFSNGTLTFLNNSTTETYPTIDIVTTVASSDLIISNGAKNLRIIFGFAIGDTIQIDFKKRKVFINGNLQMATVDLNNPNFFPLARNENTITISNNANATLTYKEAWE